MIAVLNGEDPMHCLTVVRATPIVQLDINRHLSILIADVVALHPQSA